MVSLWNALLLIDEDESKLDILIAAIIAITKNIIGQVPKITVVG